MKERSEKKQIGRRERKRKRKGEREEITKNIREEKEKQRNKVRNKQTNKQTNKQKRKKERKNHSSIANKKTKFHFKSRFEMIVSYKTLNVEERREHLVYDLGSLLAAAGGNMGLFLGLSCMSILLGIVQFLNTIFDKIM